MRTRSTGNSQRNRGQLGGVSWAAATLARLGEAVVIGLLVLGSLAPTAATASSRGPTADPAPQKAPPAPASRSATPDPAPQAMPRAQPSQSAPKSATSGTPPTDATPVTPHIVQTTAPARPSSTYSDAPARPSTASSNPAASSTNSRTVARVQRHHATISHPARYHAPPVARPAAHSISLSFLLGLLPTHLLRMRALETGGVNHRDGVLVLLGSIAMAALAMSSFSLLRRLKRLEGPT